MTKRALPVLPAIQARERIRFDVPESARARFNPALRAASGDAIGLYGPVGFENGITVQSVQRALLSAGSGDIAFTMNSPGGSFIEGIAIYNLIRAHPGIVTIQIIGEAASAASIIAMAADTIEIGAQASMMIHLGWVIALGNQHELREIADWVAPFDDATADLYAARTGKSKDEIVTMMTAETWMLGQAAVENGFADALLPADAVEETNSLSGVDMSNETAIAAAVKAERDRITGIKALDEAKGRSKLADILCTQGTTVEAAKVILAGSPKENALNAAMELHGTPGIRSEAPVDEGDGHQRHSDPADDFAHRSKIFAAAAAKRTA